MLLIINSKVNPWWTFIGHCKPFLRFGFSVIFSGDYSVEPPSNILRGLELFIMLSYREWRNIFDVLGY